MLNLILGREVEWNRVHYYWGHNWSVAPVPDDDGWWVWSIGEMIGKKNPKYSENPCPIAAMSIKNRIWPDPGSNTAHRGGKPATNRLSYRTAILTFLLIHFLTLLIAYLLKSIRTLWTLQLVIMNNRSCVDQNLIRQN
jgi:hypothetical protein